MDLLGSGLLVIAWGCAGGTKQLATVADGDCEDTASKREVLRDLARSACAPPAGGRIRRAGVLRGCVRQTFPTTQSRAAGSTQLRISS